MTGVRAALAIAVVLGLLVPAPARADGRERTRHVRPIGPVRPVFAPDARWVRPPSRIAFACDGCDPDRAPPAWVIRVGSALDGRGYELVPVRPDVVARAPAGLPADCLALVDAGAPPGARPSGTADARRPAEALPAPPAVPVLPLAKDPDDAAITALLDRLDAQVRGPADSGPAAVRYLFAVARDSDTHRQLAAQATWVAHYGKLDADFVEMADLARAPIAWLGRYAAIGLAAENLPPDRVDRLVGVLDGYVRRGGGLAALAGVGDEEARPLFGITGTGAGETVVTSLACEPAFLPASAGLPFRFDAEAAERVPQPALERGARVLCTGNPGPAPVPMAHAIRRDAGTVLAWNGGLLGDKSSRGLILLSMMEVSAPVGAALLDGLMVFVDDCPMPMWGTRQAPVDAQYDLTDAQFYTDRWWPAMKALFERYRLRPTFAFMTTYDDDVEGPFLGTGFGTDATDPAFRLAAAVAATDAEIGLHGYNHQSLSVGTSERSAGWPGRGPMEAALRRARAEMERVLGPGRTPTAYVAPNNLLHRLGKEAVHAVFPEVETLSTQYLDEDAILGQEFGPDPDVPGLVDVPRVSSEHFVDADSAQEVLNALVLPGVFSHFVHPDDVFDRERSRDLRFDGMMTSLDAVLARVDAAYPFLTRRTATGMGRAIREFDRARLSVRRGPGTLQLRAESAPAAGLTVFVRTRPGLELRVAGGCVRLFEAPAESRLYVRVGGEACTLAWKAP